MTGVQTCALPIYYKKLLIIPLAMFLIAMIMIGMKVASTGDFINRGVSLKGGSTITISNTDVTIEEAKTILSEELSNFDTNVRALTKGTIVSGIIIEASATEIEEINQFTDVLKNEMGLTDDQYTIETMGSSLGESFFRQTFRALIIAFIFMAIVVFIYFKSFIPSIAVVLAALSDMVVTLAVVNALDIKMTTAGIAAFLMLIGYSVDTDILLTTRVLKKRKGNVPESIISAMKTGMTMTLSTLVAVTIALFVAESEVLKQIMLIVFIGLIVDIINTWIQNAGIIRWYVEKKLK